MRIIVYGLTITSSWGNGHATTYRALLEALARRGHSIHFIEKDVEWYRSNRDLPQPSFCSVQLYEDWSTSEAALIAAGADADVILIGSYFPDAIPAAYALIARARVPVFFYDIDTPITLAELRTRGRTSYLEADLISRFTAYLSFTGGPALDELERTFGARRALPLYCSVNASLYHPVAPQTNFLCDLSYLGTYAADRQPALMTFLNDSAAQLQEGRFLVAGSQYPDNVPWKTNVERITHLRPPEHPAFYSSSRFTLNITRRDMVALGYSPSVRLFEASACGAPIISDNWPGLEDFFLPGEEVLLPKNTAEVVSILREMPDGDRRQIGERARQRILAEHTSDHRAVEFEKIVSEM